MADGTKTEIAEIEQNFLKAIRKVFEDYPDVARLYDLVKREKSSAKKDGPGEDPETGEGRR